ISFCAYNTGVGWRQVVEKIFQSATTAQWFKAMGKHAVYAGGKSVPLALPQAPQMKNAPARPVPARPKSDLPMFTPAPAPAAAAPSVPHTFDPAANTAMSPFNSPAPSVGA